MLLNRTTNRRQSTLRIRLAAALALATLLAACSDDSRPTPIDSDDLGPRVDMPDMEADTQNVLDASTDAGPDLAVDTGPELDLNPDLCPPDHRVESNQCTPCEPGKTRPAQDDPAGPDTECETLFCEADHFVSSNMCVPCPSGQTNAPGDDATGPDTNCTDPCLLKLGFSCDEFEDAYLKAGNAEPFDRFGYSVAYHQGLLVVGATGEDSRLSSPSDDTAPNSGAAYVFRRSAGTWVEDDYLKGSRRDRDDLFGSSVSIYNERIAVGAPGEAGADTGIGGDFTNNDAPGSGAVFIFERPPSGLGWIRTTYIKASNTDEGDNFGIAISLHEDTLAVGAHQERSNASGVGGDESNNALFASGAAYIFTYDGSAWSQEAYLKASNPDANDQFGRSIALDVDTLAVGAPFESSDATGINGPQLNNDATQSGAVYVFERNTGSWSQQAFIKASNAGAYHHFGSSLDLQSGTLLVGAPLEPGRVFELPDPDDRAESGAAYVFSLSGGAWSQQAFLKADNPAMGDRFGHSVAIDGTRIAVGAPFEATDATGLSPIRVNSDAPESGAVYLFDRNGSSWTPFAFIKASNTNPGDRFGNAVELGSGRLFVGAWLEDGSATWINGPQDNNGAVDSGAVYIRKLLP